MSRIFGKLRSVGSRLAGSLGRFPSLGFTVSNRRYIEILALVLVLFTAFAIRFLPIRWGEYLAEYDTYFQLRMATYMTEHGFGAWLNWHDTMTWYPAGRDMASNAYPGIGFSAAIIYIALRSLGIEVSLLAIGLVFPVVMGVLTCLVAYFLGKDMAGKEVGLFAAFFLAIDNAFISRTMLGFFDDETIGIFGMTLTFLCFLRSLEEQKPLKTRLLYSAVAGISIFYVMASWGAARYIPDIMALFTVAMVLTGKYSRNLLISYGIPVVLSSLSALSLPVLGTGYLLATDNIAVLGLIPLLAFYELYRRAKTTRDKRILMAFVAAAAGGALILLDRTGLLYTLPGKFWGIIDPWFRTGVPLVESVAEHRRSSWASFFKDFGIVLSLSLVGVYFSLKKIEPKRLFTFLYFITSLYFAGSMIRITLVLSAAASLMAAYGLVELVKPFMAITFSPSASQGARGRRLSPRTSPELGAVFLIILFLTITPTIINAASQAYSPGQLASSAVPAKLTGGGYPQDWIEALTWIRDNLNSSTVVVSWWDYGHWLSFIGNVTTLADGSTLNNEQIAWIAKMYMSNQTESRSILKKFNAQYIVVFLSFNPSNKQSAWQASRSR